MTKYGRRKLFALLLETQRYKCVYCRRQLDLPVLDSHTDATATFDHVKPKSAGGLDHENNLVLACWECNQAKASDHRERRLGPTPEYIATLYEDALRIEIKSHLYELERMLVTAITAESPKAKKEAAWLAYHFWEHELLETGIPGNIISMMQHSGLYLCDQAAALCWEPLYDVDTYHHKQLSCPRKPRKHKPKHTPYTVMRKRNR